MLGDVAEPHKTVAVAVTAGVGSSCSSAAAGVGAAHRTTPERRLNQRQDCARVTIVTLAGQVLTSADMLETPVLMS